MITYEWDKKVSMDLLRGSHPDDIEVAIEEAKRKMLELRLDQTPTKPHIWGKIKRDIAKMKTVMREKNG